MACVVALAGGAVLASSAQARRWVGFQFADHRGAPPTTTPNQVPPNDHDASSDGQPQGTSSMLRLAVAGDVGTGGDAAFATGRVMDAIEADHGEYAALLLLGDNIYDNGDPARVDQAVFEPFGPALDGDTQLLAALGNHDVDDGYGDAQADALGMPGRWYSTRLGDVEIFTLDSNRSGDADQAAWLADTLAASDATWKIAMLHHPPYSGGYHGSDRDVRRAFEDLFVLHGVQLVLAGHDHDYQRSRPIDGVTYVVSGGAAKLRPAAAADFTEVAWSTHHFLDLSIGDGRLVGQAIDHDGGVIDTFTLSPTPPEPADDPAGSGGEAGFDVDVDEPSGLAITTDGFATVSDTTGRISRLDINGRVTDTIELGDDFDDLEGIAVSADQQQIIVVREADNRIIVVDAATGAITSNVEVVDLAESELAARIDNGGNGLEGVAVQPGTGNVFVVKEANPPLLLALDADLEHILDTWPLDAVAEAVGLDDDTDYSGLTFGPDAGVIHFVSDRAQSIIDYDLAMRTPLGRTSIDVDKPEGIAIDTVTGDTWIIAENDQRLTRHPR